MTQTIIFQPMLALVGLTFSVLLLMPLDVFRSSRKGKVVFDDFKLGLFSSTIPGASIANRNYMNLLEMPVLFYVACLTLHATRQVDSAALSLAWLYVALRIVHTLVHLTYNNVLHRGLLFGASNLVLLVIWIRFLIVLSSGTSG